MVQSGYPLTPKPIRMVFNIHRVYCRRRPPFLITHLNTLHPLPPNLPFKSNALSSTHPGCPSLALKQIHKLSPS
jgi:hypothetical protein